MISKSKTANGKSQRGFTLIELLVVIAIIGILSSVVLASLNTARLKSRDTRRVADLKQIQLALQLYFDAEGEYPVDIYAADVLAPTYIAAVPKDPVGQVEYAYAGLDTGGTAATCESYHIGAVLEDTANAALDSDIDAANATACTGATEFHGNAADCTGTTAAGTDECYDMKP